MSHNPYAPPTVDDAPTSRSSIKPENSDGSTHIVDERRILMSGSTLFTFGLTMAMQLPVLLSDSRAVAVAVCVGGLLALSMLCAGVALWLLHPVGRWLSLAYWAALFLLCVGSTPRAASTSS